MWRLLLEDPFTVPTYLFDQLLSLEPSVPDSPPPSVNNTCFYVRSFTIKVRDLRNVFHELLDDGYDMNDRVFTWIERIELEPENAYVTLRYCGQTQNRPWDRHVSDIYSTSLKSFVGRFLKTVGKWCSQVLSEAVVQVVSGATATVPLTVDILDLREQVLIALIGDGSLNTEAGGKDIMYFTDADHDLFIALDTDAVASLKELQPCSFGTKDGIQRYTSAVRTYVQHHPSTTGGKKRFFSDYTENMLFEQGLPKVLSDGSAVLVTLGSDIGELHNDNESPFFEAGGRTADAVSTCYNHLGFWERGFGHSFDDGLTRRLARDKLLPFV